VADDQAPDEEAAATEAEAAPETQLRCGVPVTTGRDEMLELHPTREQYLDTIATLREEEHHMLLDLTAVDYLTHPGRELPEGIAAERFEVVATTIRHSEPERVRIRVQVPEGDPVLPTLFDHHPGSEGLEREVFDMFGISFDGHPDLTRILMPEDWDGHPLRKDYAVGAIPVQFKAAPSAR
jgi:NADH-quinone oxidoreductase subunit C